jgi:hypothetical protein
MIEPALRADDFQLADSERAAARRRPESRAEPWGNPRLLNEAGQDSDTPAALSDLTLFLDSADVRRRNGGDMRARSGVNLSTASAVLLAGAVLAVASPARAQQGLLAAGVGSAAGWETVDDLVNPYDERFFALLSEFPSIAFNTGCDFGCPTVPVDLPPNGSRRIPISGGVLNPENNVEIAKLAEGRLFTLFISRYVPLPNPDPHPERLPVAHVYAINGATGETTEIPVVRIDAAVGRPSPSTLVFPGVVRSDEAHCNLILSSFRARPNGPIQGDVETVSFAATVTLLDSEGTVRASRRVFGRDCIFEGKFCANVVIHDVAAFLGVDRLDAGSVRVVQTSGEVLWGQMPCVADGKTVVSTGDNR